MRKPVRWSRQRHALAGGFARHAPAWSPDQGEQRSYAPTTPRSLQGHATLRRGTARHHYSLKEAHIIIESWRRHYNTIRPHASLGYKPPAPEVLVSAFTAWPAV